jgi:glycosyltransferase involved in cell wall biosynthesis
VLHSDGIRPAEGVELVIPVYNEEGILEGQLVPLLENPPFPIRITIVENGSSDRTREILARLCGRYDALRAINLPRPNYGLAMRKGLEAATGEIVIVDDLDVLDTDFWKRGLEANAGGVDIVQGSKVLAGRNDSRPLIRKLATLALTGLLKLLFRYPGTDTHGPKVLQLSKISPFLAQCGTELDIFPTELVLRCFRAGLVIRELPIHLREIRATPFPLRKRVRRAVRDLFKLRRALRRSLKTEG